MLSVGTKGRWIAPRHDAQVIASPSVIHSEHDDFLILAHRAVGGSGEMSLKGERAVSRKSCRSAVHVNLSTFVGHFTGVRPIGPYLHGSPDPAFRVFVITTHKAVEEPCTSQISLSKSHTGPLLVYAEVESSTTGDMPGLRQDNEPLVGTQSPVAFGNAGQPYCSVARYAHRFTACAIVGLAATIHIRARNLCSISCTIGLSFEMIPAPPSRPIP